MDAFTGAGATASITRSVNKAEGLSNVSVCKEVCRADNSLNSAATSLLLAIACATSVRLASSRVPSR